MRPDLTEGDSMADGGKPSEPQATGPAPDSMPVDGDDPKAFILKRARSEVHLLLDYISASPDVTIATLAERTPPQGLPENWIEKVCEITWPPKENQDNEDLADEAALLIRARDYLNGIAKPASGATIAFTLMVTQEENSRSRRAREAHRPSSSPSRSSLACDAYPDLVPRARTFRRMLTWMIWVSVIGLAVTLIFSWYLAIGNAALADFATARTRLHEAEAQVSQAEAALAGEHNGPATSGRAAPLTPQPPATANPGGGGGPQVQTVPPVVVTYELNACATKLSAGSYPSAALRDACVALQHQTDSFNAITDGLDRWALLAGPDTASWTANLLGSAVLPVLYGFLGAIAAVVRSLSRKIKLCLLSPRDAQLSFQQLALGALIGACISLFIAGPPSSAGERSLLGPVGLSVSAVSFVAGFGVDSVFQAIEALISRIFNIAPAATTSPQPPRGGRQG